MANGLRIMSAAVAGLSAFSAAGSLGEMLGDISEKHPIDTSDKFFLQLASALLL